jgi:replicative DNA helicase
MSEQSLPSAIGPEKSVISSMLQRPEEFIPEAQEQGVGPKTFFHPSYAALVRHLYEQEEKGEPIELISLTQDLAEGGLLDKLGGAAGLTELYSHSATHSYFGHHVKAIKDAKLRRDVLAWANDIRIAAHDSDQDLMPLLTEPIDDLLKGYDGVSSIVTGKQAALEYLEDWYLRAEGKAHSQVTCGIPVLDRIRGGLDAPGLSFISAFPSMGKTATTIQVINHFLSRKSGARILVFSLEMTLKQLVGRGIQNICGFSDSRILLDPHNYLKDEGGTEKRQFTKAELKAIQDAIAVFGSDNLMIDPTAGIHIHQIAAKTKIKMRKGALDLIVVDYAQRIRGEGGNKESEMTYISGGLQQLMKMANCPVVVLSQLTEANGRIKMKYAESMEEDADFAARIEGNRETKQVDGIRIIKDRHRGKMGFYPVEFDAERQVFQDPQGREIF